jgi:acetyl/propionyl-CoA carboxylase alpha subunit
VVESLGNGRYLVSRTGDPGFGNRDSGFGIRKTLSYAVNDRARMWVFIDGRTYVIDTGDRDASPGRRATDNQLALSAPMPATVIAVNVAPGQEVAEGDVLVLLEAMKMELPIKAPHGGRVKSIACREGELVPAGVPLLELE